MEAVCPASIDRQVDDLAPRVEFWSKALGKSVETADSGGDGKYAELRSAAVEPIILLQKVAHPSRVHLDIETNDVQAEAERLVALGAKKVEKVQTWWVMEAPSGHRFCVIRQQRTPFGPHANTWPGE
ncbi:MAG: glyoxalase [Pseudoxanthomonas suwonensis]|nr:MAG: glyoxalase [Pseudoxanthomonas suwonensis]